MALDLEALVRYAWEVQRATTLRELMDALVAAVAKVTPYRNVTLAMLEDRPEGMMARVIGASGPFEAIVWDRCPLIPVAGDPFVQEVAQSQRPVVVVDARTDPRTNKALVEMLGLRTIINVPLVLGGTTTGAIGLQTLEADGCRAPSSEDLEWLTVLALQLAPAFDRVRLLAQQMSHDAEREQLKQRLRRMERIETLGLLAGGVAHDFNNLLTVISSALHFIGELDLPQQARADLEDAVDAARRAADVTRQLLAVGRKQPLRLAPTDWGERLEGVLRLLRRLVPESVEVVLDVPAGLPKVRADGVHLDQLVMNLVLNARDAMPQGGRLRLALAHARLGPPDALHPHQQEGPALTLTVQDTGVGMAPEVSRHIFEPFFTTKDPGIGTGLGLAIVQGITERHGGAITCRSAVGQGTSFEVSIPVATERADASARPAAPPRPLGGLQVLVAEDDRTVRELVARILRDAGFVVTTVPDGLAAVEAAQRSPPDLVILDAVMPRLSGGATYERLKAVLPATAWLFMTGYAAETLPPECLEARSVELLSKPWLPKDLIAAVKTALSAARD